MAGQTVILNGDIARKLAHRLIDAAPRDAIVNVRAPGRTTDQNAKFWAMLSDISRARPRGLRYTPDIWKSLAMNACGHAVQFVNGLDGEPFPIGFKSSHLTKAQMSELIEFLFQFGAENGVVWSDEARAA